MLIRFIFKNEKYMETNKENNDLNIFDKRRILELVDRSLRKFEIFLTTCNKVIDILKVVRKIFAYIFFFWLFLFILSVIFKSQTNIDLNQTFQDSKSKNSGILV